MTQERGTLPLKIIAALVCGLFLSLTSQSILTTEIQLNHQRYERGTDSLCRAQDAAPSRPSSIPNQRAAAPETRTQP
jgi:predicted cobalt transporter CbtA